MKKLLIGLLALGSISSFASTDKVYQANTTIAQGSPGGNFFENDELDKLRNKARMMARGKCESEEVTKCTEIETKIVRVVIHEDQGYLDTSITANSKFQATPQSLARASDRKTEAK